MRRLSYTVLDKDSGRTLSYIFRNVLHLSGYLIRRNKHIDDAVLVNEQHADVTTVVYEGDIISILLSAPERKSNVKPIPGPLNIIFEDEDIIVLNKAADDIVHPDHSHQENTLGNYLVDYYIRNGDPADFHPVQRLDNGTSGLIVFAKHSFAQDVLSKAIHTKAFARKYVAICSGIIKDDHGIVDAPILRTGTDSIKRCVDNLGQSAVTEYKVIKRYEDMTVVELTLHTGRTHQIRVHMSYIGHPLVGDTLYGGKTTEFLLRPALHSYEAEFVHPVTGINMKLSAALAADMALQIKAEDNTCGS